MSLEGFDAAPFSHDGVTRPVHRRGDGPGVVVVHEAGHPTRQALDRVLSLFRERLRP